MKSLLLIATTLFLASCDPFNFGFKKNPAYVLNEAFKAVSNSDAVTLIEMSGKEALCIYGNLHGVRYLKENIKFSIDDSKINPKKISSIHYQAPKYVGYWSYYNERYLIEVNDLRSNKVIFKTIVDCDYGTDDERDQRLVKINPQRYKIKECRIIKILPLDFKALPLLDKCQKLQVTL